jgi:spore maturation protein CgeB
MEILQHLSRRRPIQWPEVWGEAMVEVLNQARIVLNVHFTPQPNTEHRIIEALACGSFVLSQPLSGPTPFEDGQHLVYFDLDTVHDQIDYYLAHEDEREAIARQGHAYVTARYSARQQLAEILSLAGEN